MVMILAFTFSGFSFGKKYVHPTQLLEQMRLFGDMDCQSASSEVLFLQVQTV